MSGSEHFSPEQVRRVVDAVKAQEPELWRYFVERDAENLEIERNPGPILIVVRDVGLTKNLHELTRLWMAVRTVGRDEGLAELARGERLPLSPR